MEQARILQAIISRGLAQQAQCQPAQQAQQAQPVQQGQSASAKEITITQSGLIEVSSDDESESESESDSESDSASSDSESESEIKRSDKWSIGDEIHQADGYFEEFDEKFKKNILLDAICIDGNYVVESINLSHEHENDEENVSNKKIISLNKGALGTNDDDNDADANASDDASDDESSSSSSDEEVHAQDLDLDLNLKIGYKHKKEPLHLNYGNMSVPALRQLAKERGLGGDDTDLQKLKKKNLVQLLQ
jgi:nucleolin